MKTRTFKSQVLVLTAAALLLAVGCRHHSSNPNNVFGSGIVLRENRNVSSFHTIEIRGACHLLISQGGQSLAVEAEDNILPLVMTRVGYDGVLIVENKGSIVTDVGIKIYASLSEIHGIRVFGAAVVSSEHRLTCEDVKLDFSGAHTVWLDLEARSLETRVRGAGESVLSGRVATHFIQLEGAAAVRAIDLDSRSSRIVMRGAGSCYVSVSEALDVDISGVGSVYYRGNPGTLKSNVSGTGKLVKLN